MNKYNFSKIINALKDERGVTALEYAIIAAAIVIAVTAAVASFSPHIIAKFAALGA